MLPTIFIFTAVFLRIVSNPLANVFQKQLTNRQQHPLLINFITYLLLALLCSFVFPSIQWKALPDSFWYYSLLGGIAGAVGNGFLVKALQTGDLSVLGPVNAYKAVVGMIVGIFLLKELPNLWGLLGVALIIYGSYFVLDTTEDKFSWALLKRPEIQYRIWAMILTAVEAVFIKKIILSSSTLIAFVSWCCFGAVFSFILASVNKVPVIASIKNFGSDKIIKLLLLIACIGTMQFTTTYAFDHMPVAYALALFQLSTIVSVWMGHSFFQEKDIKKKLIGAMIMIVGSVIIILLK